MNRLSMSEAPVSRLYLSYLLPTVIAMVSNSLYCLADVYFISIGSGTLGLAAVNIVMPMYTLYSCIGLLFGVGASTIIAIERGAGHEQRADQAFSMSVAAVVISEGVITKQQVKDAETWVHYLSEHYNVRKDVLQDNYQVIKEMTEEEVNISIKLLKDLIDYQLAMLDAHPVQG